MDPLLFLGAFAGIAGTTALFVSAYLLFIHKGQRLIRMLLVGLLLSIAARMLKSVFYYLFDVSYLGVGFGFIGLTGIGIFSWLYVYHQVQKKPWNHWNWLLFLPSILGFLSIWPAPQMSTGLIYLYGNVYAMVGGLAAIGLLIKQRQVLPPKERNWHFQVLVPVFLISLLFLSQLFTDTLMDYAIGSAVAGGFFYFVFFALLRVNPSFRQWTPLKGEDQLVSKIEEVFTKDHLYRKQALNIKDLSETLDEPTYKLSKTINQHYGKSFPELVNTFRIEDVKQKILNDQYNHLKVEALAYDAGFNTPSSFYVAFKKATGTTPHGFKEANKSHSASSEDLIISNPMQGMVAQK